MQIDVKALGFELTPALRIHAERRLHFALGRADPQVSRLRVQLSGLSGARAGEDKRCQVRITLAGAPEVVVEDTEADLYTAIDRAADRAGRTAMRRLQRSREQHQGWYSPPADIAAPGHPTL
jgi:putative sigma-54 modulation protein